MCYSVDPRDRIYVKDSRFSSFAKYMGKHLSNKYGTKLLDGSKKSIADAIKLLQLLQEQFKTQQKSR